MPDLVIHINHNIILEVMLVSELIVLKVFGDTKINN